jgi:hypothetical protein
MKVSVENREFTIIVEEEPEGMDSVVSAKSYLLLFRKEKLWKNWKKTLKMLSSQS